MCLRDDPRTPRSSERPYRGKNVQEESGVKFEKVKRVKVEIFQSSSLPIKKQGYALSYIVI